MIFATLIRAGKGLLPIWIKKNIQKIYPLKPLHKRLPLDFPLTMHIDPCNICNFKCIFCPTGDSELLKEVGREPCLMKIETFKKVVDDLAQLLKNKNARIPILHIYKDGEPLLNPHFFEMVQYAKQNKVASTLSTTTNGSLITEESAFKLLNCGLDKIRISIEHVNTKGYESVCKSKISYENIRENVILLNKIKHQQKCNLYIIVKITDTGLSKDDLKKFKKDFTPFCDELRIDSLMGWSNCAKKDFTLGRKIITGMNGYTKIHNQIVCADPFSSLSVNSNGSVSICCVDWSHGIIVGDVLENSIAEIWNGDKYREIRRLHLSGNKERIKVCSNCQYANGTSRISNLDPHRERLSRFY